MRVFGSVDPFVEGPARDLRLGRVVANLRFLHALVRHGTFDAYHLFCPSVSQMRQVERALSEELADVIGRRRIGLSTHLTLHQHLLDVPYAAFHVGGWGLYLPRLAYLRRRTRAAGGPGFPITGITHSLHTADIFLKMREMVAAPFGPGDAVVCTSEGGREVMRRHWEEATSRARAEAQPGLEPLGPGGEEPPPRLRFAHIPLGVEPACFEPPDRGESRAALGLPAGATICLYLGRLSAQTKADLNPLLYAFARLIRRPERAGALLVLAGGADGANLGAIEATRRELGLGERLRLLPNTTDAQKYQLLAASDFFVSPIDNYQETFGLAVVEAMAAGLPALVSDFDGYRELVEDGRSGYTIPTCGAPLPGHVNELLGVLDPNLAGFLLAQAVAVDMAVLERRMSELFDDAATRRRLGEGARRRAQRYAWSRIIPAYEELWDELAPQARAAPPSLAPDPDPHVGDLQQVFSHYPTGWLGGDDRLRLSDLGREVMAGKLPVPPLYEDLAPLLVPELGPYLLGLFVADAPVTATACCDQAERNLGVPRAYTVLQVIWLLKQGLLERSGGPPG